MEEPARAKIVWHRMPPVRFEIASRVPRAPLRPAMRLLHGFQERSERPLARREFPCPQVVLIVQLGTPLGVRSGDTHEAQRFSGGFVVGLAETFLATAHSGKQTGIELRLSPLAARGLLGFPLHEIAGRLISLEELLPIGERRLAQRVAEASGWDARLDTVEQLLLRRLRAAPERLAPVAFAIEQIERSAGRADIRGLAREIGCSGKHLIELFRDGVGVSPKRYARLVRFDRLARWVHLRPQASWAQLAVTAGYFDESHLAREVVRFSGLTPARWAAALRGLPFIDDAG